MGTDHCLSQIRSGCSPLVRATLFRIGLATSSLCGQCGEEDTVVHLLCECLAAQERKPGSGGRSPPSRMCSRGRLNTSRSSSTEWGGPRHLWTSPGLPRPRSRPAVRGRRRRESRLTHPNRRIYPSLASRTTSRSAPSTWPATSRTGWPSPLTPAVTERCPWRRRL